MSKPKPHDDFDLTYPGHYCPGPEYGVEDPNAEILWPEDWSFDQAAGCLPPQCPFCKERMELVTLSGPVDAEHPGYDREWEVSREYFLLNCPYCSHWQFKACENLGRCMTPLGLVDALSIARRFSSPIPDGCASEVAQQLRRDPAFWHSMAPRDMERFVADLFRANYRHAEVFHVGRPGDLGVDVLYIDAEGNDWLVQVKRRESPNAVEGFETLQQLLGTLYLEGKVRGIIATTASKFSKPLLLQKARAEEQCGVKIDLLDRGKLDRMLNPVLPIRPWLALLHSDAVFLVDEQTRRHFVTNTSDPRQLRFC